MPGLNQLKQFNKDILSLGDEPNLRAARGEQPVRFPIPKSIEDRDDSEDFVLGMPEIEAVVDDSQVDDDLSEITGIKASSSEGENAGSSFETPDLSNLLNLGPAADDSSGGEMPDLSMFMESVEEEADDVVEEEPEPEEISVADMGLEALLSGAGFDGSEGTEDDSQKKSSGSDDFYDFDELEDLDNEKTELAKEDDIALSPELQFDSASASASGANNSGSPDLQSLGIDDLEDLEDLEDLDEIEDSGIRTDSGENFGSDVGLGSGTDLGSGADSDFSSDLDLGGDLESIPDFDLDAGLDSRSVLDDLAGADIDAGLNLGSGAGSTADSLSDIDLDSGASAETDDFADTGFDAGLDDLAGSDVDAGLDDLAASDFGTGLDDLDGPGLEDLAGTDFDALSGIDSGTGTGADDLAELDLDADSTSDANDFAATDFDLDAGLDSDKDLGSAAELGSDTENGFGEALASDADIDSDTGLDSIGDIGSDSGSDLDLDGELESIPDFDLDSGLDSGAGVDDLADSDSGSGVDDLAAADSETGADDLAELDLDADSTSDANDFAATDFDLDADLGNLASADSGSDLDSDSGADDPFASASPEGLFDAGDMELPDLDNPSGFNTDNLFTSEIPDYDDGADSSASQNSDGAEESETLEVFDTSGMDDDIDFGISDTDSTLAGGGDFELGNADDFAMEGSDFEIPGFSDVESIEDKKTGPVFGGKTGRGRGKNSKLDTPDFSGAIEGEKLPPNTLSDEQYKQFLKNLSEYPLNVRLAFEDFIVQDEFTDDAEFEVIEKILNKGPARQDASVLEKMLDISIPVPRDFEHRTAEEYEAYKKSIQYQLRNKIIPAMIVGVVMILVGWGLFNFGKFCIYVPAKAVSLYKQGYALIQADEYPQSEQKFKEAVKYKLNKKWFFNYARAYREHKQYQRSSDMYIKILRNFKQDKQAGLEYADMMLNDLSNYERAEEILNREVLDYHINDADGRLLLGDTYLEWGTEKEPSKLDLAKEQYSMLSQIYGVNDLYNSRLMRYYVRTDNLLQVLNYKAIFENKEKSLSAQDFTEMSGYLLDKLYGPLSPSEEPLRTHIEGIKPLLIRSVKLDSDNAVGFYNLGKYYINTNEIYYVEHTLKDSIEKFGKAETLKKRDIYKYIDAHRLLGENYIKTGDTMKAQEQYTAGISLYTTERDNSGFEGNLDIGKLYSDLADINYFISGDYELAKENYKHSIELGNDSPSIRYRIGYVNYRNKNYQEALGSFMKAGEANRKEDNLLLAMANTLSLRNDDYSAEGYYEQLLARLDDEIAEKQLVLPQTSSRDYDIVNTYLKASNNYGVTLHRLAKRTGNSSKNALAIVQFQQSLRAWDALTRNQDTLVRMDGSNLAQENIKYITHMYSDYEPAIYIDIPRTLSDGEGL